MKVFTSHFDHMRELISSLPFCQYINDPKVSFFVYKFGPMASLTIALRYGRSPHAGVYWCGVESSKGSYRDALREIQLEVKGEKLNT